MRVDEEQRSMFLKVVVVAADNAGADFVRQVDGGGAEAPKPSLLQRVSRAMGLGGQPAKSGGDVVVTTLELGPVAGWTLHFDVCAVVHPSWPAARLLTMKYADAVIMVMRGEQEAQSQALLDEVRDHLEQLGQLDTVARVAFVVGEALAPALTTHAALVDAVSVVGDTQDQGSAMAAMKAVSKLALLQLKQAAG